MSNARVFNYIMGNVENMCLYVTLLKKCSVRRVIMKVQHIPFPKHQYSSAEKGKETNTHELMQDLSERVVE